MMHRPHVGWRQFLLLSVAMGPSLVGLYFALSFASQLGSQVGHSELQTLVVLACVSAIAPPLLSPLGTFVAPRKLAAATMLVAATLHLCTPAAPADVAWLLQVAAAAAVFAPWPVAERLAESPGWSTSKTILWWLGGYAVMALCLAAPSVLPRVESLHVLQMIQVIWGAALALGALVVVRHCPNGRLQRPGRWWQAWTGGLPTPLAIGGSVVCGLALTPYDGLLQFAMVEAGLTRGEFLLTNIFVLVGLVGFWIARYRRARSAGAVQAAGLGIVLAAVLGAVAAQHGSWALFAVSRTNLELYTSFLTAFFQSDPRTAAMAQLFKQLGSVTGVLAGASAWERHAWLGVSTLVAIAGLVCIGWGFVTRVLGSTVVADGMNRTFARWFDANAEHLDGRAVLARAVPDFYLAGSRFALPALRRALAAAAGISVLDLLACDAPQILLALARLRADPDGLAVAAENGVLVMKIGRRLVIRIEPGAVMEVERKGRRPRITAPVALATATWGVPVEDLAAEAERHAVLGAHLRERLDADRPRRADPLVLVPVLGRLLTSPPIEHEDLIDALASDHAGAWPVLEECSEAQLACLVATGARVRARQHQPWLSVTLPGGDEAYVLTGGRIPNAAAQGGRKPRHRAPRSARPRHLEGVILGAERHSVEVSVHTASDARVQAAVRAMGERWSGLLFGAAGPVGTVATATIDGAPIGMAVLEQDASGARVIRSVWVRPDWLGRDVETKLLAALSKASARAYGVAATISDRYAGIWAPTPPTSVSSEHQPVPV